MSAENNTPNLDGRSGNDERIDAIMSSFTTQNLFRLMNKGLDLVDFLLLALVHKVDLLMRQETILVEKRKILATATMLFELW